MIDILVSDREGRALSKSRVTLTPTKSSEEIDLPYNGFNKSFYAKEIEPGTYTLIVRRRGFEKHIQEVRVEREDQQLKIQLKPKEESVRHIYQGSKQFEYTLRDNELAILPKIQSKEDYKRFNKLLGLKDLPEILEAGSRREFLNLINKHLNNVIYKPEEYDGEISEIASDRKRIMRSLRESDLVQYVGPIVSEDNEQLTLLSETIVVETATSMSDDHMQQIAADYGLTFEQPVSGAQNLFIAVFDIESSDEIEYTIEKMLKDERVKRIENQTIESELPYENTPTDWLWPATWSRIRVNSTEAWRKLGQDRGANSAYGDPSIITTVIDGGVDTSSGVPNNPEFKDGNTDSFQTQTSAPIGSTTNTITLTTTPTFTTTDQLRIGNGKEAFVNVHSIAGNVVTIDPLSCEYPVGTLVAPLGGSFHYLALPVIVNTTTITLATAPGFTTADTITIGSGAEGKISVAAISGNDITISSLQFNYPAGTKITSSPTASVNSLHNPITKTTSTFSVGNTNQFSNGQYISVGAQGAGTTEQVLIHSKTVNSLTTTPLRNHHPLNTVVEAGRKLIEAQSIGGGVANNDNTTNPHGIECAGITGAKADNTNSEGSAGMAPNVRLVSVIAGSSFAEKSKAFLWAAGVENFSKTSSPSYFLPRPHKGSDVFTVSLGIGKNQWGTSGAPNDPKPLDSTVAPMFEKVTRRGRDGRGTLVFMSAGNEDYNHPTNRWSSHPKALSCAATWLQYYPESSTGANDDYVKEVKAGYSNWSQPNSEVEWAGISGQSAVTNSGGTYPTAGSEMQNPPFHHFITTPTFVGGGHVPAYSQESQQLTAAISAGTFSRLSAHADSTGTVTTLVVANSGLFAVNDPIMVDKQDAVVSSISGFSNSLVLDRKLDIDPGTVIPKETPVYKVSTLTVAATVAVPDPFANYTVGDWVMLENPGQLKYETTKIQAKTATTLTVYGPINDHSIGTPIHRGPNNYNNNFNGTSAATPNCAGIGALVLSVNPQLSWLEARQILRDSAVKVDVGNIGFPTQVAAGGGQANGNGGTVGAGIWKDTDDNPVITVVTSGGNKEAHIVTVSNANTTLNATATIGTPTIDLAPNTNNNNLEVGQAIQIGSQPDVDHSVILKKTVDSVTSVMTLTIEPLTKEHLAGATVQGGLKPEKSAWYGYGRLDAERAVDAAIAFDHDDRDLMIRNYLYEDEIVSGVPEQDPGNVATDLEDDTIFSPDIWIRKGNDAVTEFTDYQAHGPHENAKTGFEVTAFAGASGQENHMHFRGIYRGTTATSYEIEITSTTPAEFTWTKAGGTASVAIGITLDEHEIEEGLVLSFDSLTGHTSGNKWTITATPEDRYIYARVTNRGNNFDMESLPATVRFYVGVTDGSNVSDGTAFDFTMGWNDSYGIDNITTGHSSVYFVGEKNGLESTSIPAQGHHIEKVTWSSDKVPPTTTKLKTYLIAEVTPRDGELAGSGADKNNNISYREIMFCDGFFGDTSGGTLIDSITADEFGTVTTTAFDVTIHCQLGYFTTEHLRVRLERENDNATTTTVTYLYDSDTSSWTLEGDNTLTWVTMNPPKLTSTGTPAASGEQIRVNFTGSFDATKLHNRVNLYAEVATKDGKGVLWKEEHEVAIIPANQLPAGVRTVKPELHPRSHVFADMANLTQSVAQAFGPDSSNPSDEFHTTATFSISGATKAYAAVNGFVLVQPGTTGTVNLILKPFTQAMAGFTPVRYFIYRGLDEVDFLNTTDTTKVVAKGGSNTPFIANMYQIHEAQNDPPTAPLLSTAFGYNNQTATDLLDSYFYGGSTSFQPPFVSMGTHIGNYKTGGTVIGFEIVLEEGSSFQPDFAFARLARNTIKVDVLPFTTDPFKKKVKREEILNFIDPVAFYGMHHTEKGLVKVPDGTGGTIDKKGDDIYADVVSCFETRHRLYIDIRSENTDSYNFYGNYKGQTGDPDLGKQIRIGITSGPTTAEFYHTDDWPLIIRPGAAVNTTNEYNEVFMQLRIDDNLKPVLYVEQGKLTTGSSSGKFADGDQLHPGTATPPWTMDIGFQYPNTGASGAKWNVATLLKMQYARKLDGTTSWPPEVVQTNNYYDNVFGPVDFLPSWNTTDNIKWISMQDRKFIDGETKGFEQMAERGIAFEGLGSGTGRVIMFANAIDNKTDGKFIPENGITGGVSKKASFFEEALLFENYRLQFDKIEDGGTAITTLNFTSAKDGIPVSGLLLLAISESEFTTLKGLTTLDGTYKRTLLLEEHSSSPVASFDKSAKKYKVGLQGLNASGNYASAFPTSDIIVYSLDDLFFFSDAFSQDEPIPTTYTASYEESIGDTEKHGANTAKILKATTFLPDSFTVAGQQVLKDLYPSEPFSVSGSTGNDGNYIVEKVKRDKVDTKITVDNVPDGTDDGNIVYSAISWGNYFIGRDLHPALAGIDDFKSLVTDLRDALLLVNNDSSAKTALTGLVNTYSAHILNRAFELAKESNDCHDDRLLYWTRLEMAKLFKSHDYLIQSFSDRNELLQKFEIQSRNLHLTPADFSSAAAGDKKILVLGFDPFIQDPLGDMFPGNAAGAAALQLHKQTLTKSGSSGYILSAILPVRYSDFDAGIIDFFIYGFLQSGQVDMILSISTDGSSKNDYRFDVQRFATLERGYKDDNASDQGRTPVFYEPNAQNTDIVRVVDKTTLPKHLETTLPISSMVPLPNKWKEGKGIFNQSYTPDGAPARPKDNGGAVNTSTDPVPAASDDLKQGSNGNFLFNETFYRIAHIREKLNSNVPTGHIQIPTVQQTGKDIDLSDTQDMIDDLVKIIKEAITGL